MKVRRQVTRLTGEQLAALRAMAGMLATQATRQAAEQPARRDRLRRDAATYRRLAEVLAGAVAGEVVVWVPDD